MRLKPWLWPWLWLRPCEQGDALAQGGELWPRPRPWPREVRPWPRGVGSQINWLGGSLCSSIKISTGLRHWLMLKLGILPGTRH